MLLKCTLMLPGPFLWTVLYLAVKYVRMSTLHYVRAFGLWLSRGCLMHQTKNVEKPKNLNNWPHDFLKGATPQVEATFCAIILLFVSGVIRRKRERNEIFGHDKLCTVELCFFSEQKQTRNYPEVSSLSIVQPSDSESKKEKGPHRSFLQSNKKKISKQKKYTHIKNKCIALSFLPFVTNT